MPHRVAILFDSHTPYLAFRVNSLQRELKRRGLDQYIELHVILIGANWSSYGWKIDELNAQYEMPLHVLSDEFHGLGFRSFLHPSLPGILVKLLLLYYRLCPRITLVGGYDRPESMFCRLLSYPLLAKVGVMHDSRFNDQESFSKRMPMEVLKSLVVGRYSFFMCSGRECAEYTRFLAGPKQAIYTEAWNTVDNNGIAAKADDSSNDAALIEKLGMEPGAPFFFYPARFIPKKNIPLVLSAYGTYIKNLDLAAGTPHKLVLCGQGPQQDLIRKIIAEESLDRFVNICSWLPYEQMPRACRLSTALLLASTHDQWGMTVNEALSAGTPVIVSNRSGAHELVRNNENGFTFSPDDAEHLASLLRHLHEDPALVVRLRKACRPSMKRFSIDQYIQRHLDLFSHYRLIPPAPTIQ